MEVRCVNKLQILIAFLLVAATVLSGCSKEDVDAKKDYGKIQDVEISDAQDAGYEEDTIFKEAGDDLGYEYVQVDSKRAEMRFQVPKTWTVKMVNQRFLSVQAPEDDPLLPGVTLNIQHGFGFLGEYNRNMPDEFEEFFAGERQEVTYRIEGGDFYQSYMGTPTRAVAHDEITDAGNLTMHIYENAPMYQYRLGKIPSFACTALYAYVKWQNLPHCFSIVCNSEKEEAAEKLLTYITSTIKLSKAKVTETKEETIDGVTFLVPKEFERVKTDLGIALRPSMMQSSYFGGSVVTVIDLEEGFEDQISGQNGLGEKLCRKLLSDAYRYVIGYWGEPEDVSIGGTPAKLYYYTCDIFGTGKIIDPLPPVSNGYFYLYCYDKGGKQKAVVLLTSATPENAIISLGNLIEERTKIS